LDNHELLKHAYEAFHNNDIRQARALFNSIQGEGAIHGERLHGLALIERKEGNYVRSEALANDAIQVCPEMPNFYLTKGIAQQLLGSLKQSIETFRLGTEINPYYPELYNSAGVSFRKAQRYEDACECYDAGIEKIGIHFLLQARNDKNNHILNKVLTTHGTLVNYTLSSCMQHAALSKEISAAQFPSCDQEALALGKVHMGMYWADKPDKQGRTARLYLDNGISAVLHTLSHDALVPFILENKSNALSLMGNSNEAEIYQIDADELRRLQKLRSS